VTVPDSEAGAQRRVLGSPTAQRRKPPNRGRVYREAPEHSRGGGRRIANRIIVYDTQSAAQHVAQVKLVYCLFVIYSDIQLFPLFRYSNYGPRKPLLTRRQ
jgi:hypothetical protein